MSRPPAFAETNSAGSITDVKGIRVGHFTETRRPTGCTVILTPPGTTGGVDVRGSAPGTRETDLLDPVNSIQEVHGVLLSGGSAFGLDAAAGVVRFLAERGIGFSTSAGVVPIVPAAILYDLAVGDNPSIRPGEEAGYSACQNAVEGDFEQGSVGAGTGASVGKLRGLSHAMKGGLGSASIRVDRLVVGALAVVNSVGDVRNPETGTILAGVRNDAGDAFADAVSLLRSRLSESPPSRTGENTALVVVATNAAFGKSETNKIAQMAHDGLARAINPVHTPWDGDTVFSLATGEQTGIDLGQAGALAAEAVAEAVVQAILRASGLPGLPAHRDLSHERNDRA
jgi:L-aminopeptidase/D-esterase-like protein